MNRPLVERGTGETGYEKRVHVNQSTTTSSAILTQENLSQNTSFSIDFSYDDRSVLKPYDSFFDVHNSRKRVVGLIYTKQFMSSQAAQTLFVIYIRDSIALRF